MSDANNDLEAAVLNPNVEQHEDSSDDETIYTPASSAAGNTDTLNAAEARTLVKNAKSERVWTNDTEEDCTEIENEIEEKLSNCLVSIMAADRQSRDAFVPPLWTQDVNLSKLTEEQRKKYRSGALKETFLSHIRTRLTEHVGCAESEGEDGSTRVVITIPGSIVPPHQNPDKFLSSAWHMLWSHPLTQDMIHVFKDKPESKTGMSDEDKTDAAQPYNMLVFDLTQGLTSQAAPSGEQWTRSHNKTPTKEIKKNLKNSQQLRRDALKAMVLRDYSGKVQSYIDETVPITMQWLEDETVSNLTDLQLKYVGDYQNSKETMRDEVRTRLRDHLRTNELDKDWRRSLDLAEILLRPEDRASNALNMNLKNVRLQLAENDPDLPRSAFFPEKGVVDTLPAISEEGNGTETDTDESDTDMGVSSNGDAGDDMKDDLTLSPSQIPDEDVQTEVASEAP